MNRGLIVVLTVLGFSAAHGAGPLDPPHAHAAARKPNVVFLLVDDLGWGDFGFNGAEFYETPNIDRLATEGMRFNNGYAACTVCSPSRAAILTGCYPARLKLTDWITGHKKPYAKLSVPEWETRLAHSRILLPEALKEGGYDTAYFGKWHIQDQTFDRDDVAHHGFDINSGGKDIGMTDDAIQFLSQGKTQPFLAVVSYYNPHDICEWGRKKAGRTQDVAMHNGEVANPRTSRAVGGCAWCCRMHTQANM